MAEKSYVFVCIRKTQIRVKEMLLRNLGHVTCAGWCTIESTQRGALCNGASAEFYSSTHNATVPLKITGGKHWRDVLRGCVWPRSRLCMLKTIEWTGRSEKKVSGRINITLWAKHSSGGMRRGVKGYANFHHYTMAHHGDCSRLFKWSNRFKTQTAFSDRQTRICKRDSGVNFCLSHLESTHALTVLGPASVFRQK